MRRTLALTALLILVGCASPEEVEADQKERKDKIAEDVTMGECKLDEAGFMIATLTVTNNSSDPSTYSIEVAFESTDGKVQYDTGSAFVNELNSGQTTTVEANSLAEPPGEFDCRIADVSRFAS